VILDDFQRLLDYDKYEDLQRMSILLARIPEGLGPLHQQFQEYVHRTGQQAVSKLVTESGANLSSLELKPYVDSLFHVVSKYRGMVQRSFQNERGFVAAFEKACRGFVNLNPATGTSVSKASELLANRADELLHKSNRLSGEGELEEALSRLVCSC
jgi:cullin 1